MKAIESLLSRCDVRVGGNLRRAVIVGADSDVVLQSLELARNWVSCFLVGDSASIKERIVRLGISLGDYEIIHATDEQVIADKAVELCGDADLVVKGDIHTDIFMRSLLGRGAGLRGDRICSHIFYMASDNFPHAYFISDCALNFAATGEVGESILQNLAEFSCGIEGEPSRIALLSATEVMHPKIASSIEADRLLNWAHGALPSELANNIMGPVALDGAINPLAAQSKGLIHVVAGRANALLVPSIESGNILFKSLVHFSGAIAAGVIIGARLPIVLTSRSDSAESRFASLALAIIG